MAIVVAPALSQDASGNVGGLCYASWRNIKVARGAWTGVVPNTTLQLGIQSKMTEVSQAWSTLLSASQRQSWADLAKGEIYHTRLNTAYRPNGYGVFMKRNLVRLCTGYAILLTAPVADEAMFAGELHLRAGATNKYHVQLVAVYDPVKITATASKCDYWKSPSYVSAGYHAQPNEFRQYDTTAASQELEITSTDHGLYVWWRARTVRSTGIVGNWFEVQYQIP